MEALVDTDIDAFAARALAWVARAPVVNNVLASNAEAVRDGRVAYEGALWIAVVDRDGQVCGAAMHTPPYDLFVCPMPVDAVDAVARALAGIRPDLPGVAGETATSAQFVTAWQSLTGASVRQTMAQRLYSLESVIRPAKVQGRLRVADSSDRDLLLDWWTAFLIEAVPDHPGGDVPGTVDRLVADEDGFLWETDGKPVCLAAARPPAAGVVRIGPVYTPPEHRRRGYAGACVAEVSQRSLDAGASHCALYTDLSNPTSNGVYRRLGYRPVVDSQQYCFTYWGRSAD